MKRMLSLALVLLMSGCAEEVLRPVEFTPGPPPPPPPPTGPVPTVAVVSGNGQTGIYGQLLGEPLVVRVTDRSGQPIANVTVVWAVSVGAGEFGSWWRTVTGPDGLASNTFRAFWPAPVVVTATADGLHEPPATFGMQLGGVPTIRVSFTPLFDCIDDAEWWDFVYPPGAYPVGSLIDWRVLCGGRLRTVSVPAGGTPFDLELSVERDAITPLDAAGDWTVEEVHTRKTVTLRVR